jgi:hypothetical protein
MRKGSSEQACDSQANVARAELHGQEDKGNRIAKLIT